MLKLSPVSISDKEWIDKIVFADGSGSADYNFGNIYVWANLCNPQVGSVGDRLIIKLNYGGKLCFSCPVGTGPIAPAVEAMKELAESECFPFAICGVTEKYKALLEKEFPGVFTFTPERDRFDYVYSASRLASLEGKKLHAKRNHINRFIQQNNWSFSRLTSDDFPECRELLRDWESGEKGTDAEHDAIERALSEFDALNFVGGVLHANSRIVAFTIGELISHDTFDVHFEKAYTDVNGAYPMINREFVRYVLSVYPDVKYINREEDLGIENLRKAKLSYSPEFLLEKYIAVW